MKTLVYSTLSMFACILLCSACEKEAADWTFSTDDTMADLSFNDIYNVMNGEDDANNTLRACANLTLSSTTFPITVTADFNGTTGCGDGRVRSGVLTAVYSGRWNSPGTTVTITTSDYTVNGYRVEGTNIITNTSTTGNPSFSSEIQNGKITTPDGDVILREANKSYEWTEGSATPLDLSDDVWQMAGNASGTTSSGKDYTAEITTPVIKANSCNWIQQGVIEITPSASGSVMRSVNYGPNVCDNIASVSYGNWTANITMN